MKNLEVPGDNEISLDYAIQNRFPLPSTYFSIIETIQGKEYAELYKKVIDIANDVRIAGGKALLVGGSVRDSVMGIVPKDFDLEVYGLQPDTLEKIAQAHGKVSDVGKSFGILKLSIAPDLDIDISIPRRDSKISEGHKGFDVKVDPFMSIKDAARRRDFTINSVAADPLTGTLFDPFNGIHDIKNRILKITDKERFKDDPLRVLRGIQFASRFGMRVEPYTFALMQTMLPELQHLPKERIFNEWKKMLLKSQMPSVGLSLAMNLGLLQQYHEQLYKLKNTPQEPAWHPEGDVWVHTLLVVDASVKLFEKYDLSEQEKLTIILAALSHDLGKPYTTYINDKYEIVSPGHEPKGVEPTMQFLESIGAPAKLIERVPPIVANHLIPSMFYIADQIKNEKISDAAIRRLANRLYPATIKELVVVAEADHLGRGYFKPEFKEQLLMPDDKYPAGEWLLQKAKQLDIESNKPKSIMRGKDFISIGFKPGPNIGKLIKISDELRDLGYTREDIINLIIHAQNSEEALAILQSKLQ